MSFSEWKLRSKKYQNAMRGHGIGRSDAEELCQAAYKAGQRDGNKQEWRSALGDAANKFDGTTPVQLDSGRWLRKRFRYCE